MDRAQHQRYLAYLKRYEYFGFGQPRLSAVQFTEFEGLLEQIPTDTEESRKDRARIRKVLLKD